MNAAIEALTGPYQTRLYDERVALLTPEVQAMIRKPERDRTPEEQKIFDDYYPVLRIDPDKIKEVDAEGGGRQIQCAAEAAVGHRAPAGAALVLDGGRRCGALKQKSYVLTTGDPKKPEKDNPVEPGFPFQPANIDFRDGRREAFVEWLTAPANPLFARVAVNRVWGWHFGEGLQRVTSDFGLLGGMPSNPETARLSGLRIRGAQLQHEVAAQADRDLGYLSTLIESRAGAGFAATLRSTPAIPISGISACSVWPPSRSGIPSITRPTIWTLRLAAKSFQLSTPDQKQKIFLPKDGIIDARTNRRGVYMVRGYIPEHGRDE